jgi:hypothetical protein
MKEEDKAEKWAFEIFAGFYPHEAHGYDPQRFCDYVRSKGYDLTDKQIVELLN